MSDPGSTQPLPDNEIKENVRPHRINWVFIGITILLFAVLVFAAVVPDVGSRPATKRSVCKNNLKQIGLALHNYHDEHGCFPPAYVAGADGRPLYSWRVLLLPYVAQTTMYEAFRLDEPWDSSHNAELTRHALIVFNCPGEHAEPSVFTNYVAVVGPNTAFPGTDPVGLADLENETDKTVLVVEVKNSGIHWAEPRDLHVLQMARTINPDGGQGISSVHGKGAHVLLADGRVEFMPDTVSAKMLEQLIDINDGQPADDF